MDAPMTFTDLVPLLAAATNAHAIAIVIGIRRSTPASIVQRLARRTWISVLALLGFAAIAYAVALRQGQSIEATDPTQTATRLANAISEALNCGAFVVLGSVLPIGVAIWLTSRAKRAP
jgi:hypothetical protein